MDECQGVSGFASPAGPADAVDIVLVAVRHAVVDDMGDVFDIDTTGSDVGRDQDFDLVRLELIEGALALALALAAVDGVGIEAASDEFVAEAFDAALGLVEDDSLFDTVFTRRSCSFSSFS